MLGPLCVDLGVSAGAVTSQTMGGSAAGARLHSLASRDATPVAEEDPDQRFRPQERGSSAKIPLRRPGCRVERTKVSVCIPVNQASVTNRFAHASVLHEALLGHLHKTRLVARLLGSW